MNNAEWVIDALTLWGNIIRVEKELTQTSKVGTPPANTGLWWAYSMLEQQFEDEVGYSQYLITENSENSAFIEMLDSCEFAHGKELTGNLHEWIMNPANKYES